MVDQENISLINHLESVAGATYVNVDAGPPGSSTVEFTATTGPVTERIIVKLHTPHQQLPSYIVDAAMTLLAWNLRVSEGRYE